MTEFAISFVVYLCVVGGALVGIGLNRILPPDHIKEDTRQVVNVATGVVATLAALVLGLMVASAKSSFDDRIEEVRQSGARLIMLDRSLRHYGPEAKEVRDLLRQLTEARVNRVWVEPVEQQLDDLMKVDATGLEQVRSRLLALTPGNEGQKWRHAHALSLTADLEQARWMLLERPRSSIPVPFLVVVGFWLAVIFASLGLFAPRNGTAYTIMLVGALSVATAVFLILEMDSPFQGLLQISNAPLRNALQEMSR
jgi:hypothetical protein